MLVLESTQSITMKSTVVILLLLMLDAPVVSSFSPVVKRIDQAPALQVSSATREKTRQFESTNKVVANELVHSLVVDHQCFSTETGAKIFGEACTENVIYDDCSESKRPFQGKEAVLKHMLDKVAARRNRGELRLDRITDGKCACGFAWTCTSGNQEGLRGTTFIELNNEGQIQYIREIDEPMFKPGDSMVGLLDYISGENEARQPLDYKRQNTDNCQ